MAEQTKALAPSAPKKISRDTLSQVHDYYLPLIREQFSQHGLEMDNYQAQCAMNAMSTIFSLIRDKGKSISDIENSNMREVVGRVALLRLNSYSMPREVYFKISNKKFKGKDGVEYWASVVEEGIEGDGNDAILRNFGAGVDEVFSPWLVRENDKFVYPKHKGITVADPEWEPTGTGRVVRIVYPVKMKSGTVEYHIAERADVRKNIIAHVSNNLMNETFGLAESRYKATAEQKKKIDAKKEALKALMDSKTVEDILAIPELEPYISPAWKEEHSSESMIVRKMRNNAIKPIPKDFGSSVAAHAYVRLADDSIFAEIEERANKGPVIDIEDAEYTDVPQGVDAVTGEVVEGAAEPEAPTGPSTDSAVAKGPPPSEAEEVLCGVCGKPVLPQKGKDGAMKTPAQVKEALGGMCAACYRKEQAKGKKEAPPPAAADDGQTSLDGAGPGF